MLPLQCRLTGLPLPTYCRSWIDAKASFCKKYGSWPRSQPYMMEYLGVVSSGRAHSGIDDCHNLLGVLKALSKFELGI